VLYLLVLTLHILAATVWTGGHLVLCCTVLPRVLREGDVAALKRFESGYERIGIPALIIQVATGLWMAHRVVPDLSRWLSFADPVSRSVGIKVLLLLATVAFALDARLRLIPRLTPDRLGSLAWAHIVPVTVISVAFVVIGVGFRVGGWF